jgi:predicted negative regulator of RcsB-dependent stress response
LNKQLKHQIKQDELVTGVQHAASFLHTHKQEVKVTAAAIVAAVLAVGGFTYYRQTREADATRALSAALETFHAPVAGESPQLEPAPTAVRFATSAEKFKQAVGEFDGVGRRYGSMDAGKRARYYAALCRLELGEVAVAEKELQELSTGDKSALEPALARLALADAYRRAGKVDQAVAAYREMADDATLAVPRDHVLITLAHTLEDASRLDEAGASYKRLAEEFPASPYAADARQRAAYLEGASRG